MRRGLPHRHGTVDREPVGRLDQLDDAVETVQAIILAERHRIRRVGTAPIAPLLTPQQTKG
jgi:hypothetical protein